MMSQQQPQHNERNQSTNSVLEDQSQIKYEQAPIYTLPDKEFTLVEVPLVVRNHDKAIDLLGGVSSIEEVVNKESKFLKLQFREGLAHGTYGDRVSTNHILLRVRRNKKNRREFKFDVVGKIVNCVGFQGMVDFQYMQEHTFDASKTSLSESASSIAGKSDHLASSKDSNIQTRLLKAHQVTNQATKEQNSESTSTDADTNNNNNNNNSHTINANANNNNNAQPKTTDFEELHQPQQLHADKEAIDERLNIAPPIFSRFDMPLDYEFRANPLSKMVTVKRDDGTVIFKRQITKKRGQHAIIFNIDPSDPTPSGPRPDVVPLDEDDQELLQEVKQLFEKREIWSKKAIAAQFESKRAKVRIKFILAHVAYCFQSGPWRKLFCKFSVNPRTDPKYGRYQSLDFRVPVEFKQEVAKIRKEKGLMSESEEQPGAKRGPRRKAPLHSDLKAAMYSTSSTAEEPDDEDKVVNESYIFASIPQQQQTLYQLCDIRLKQVQAIVKCENAEEEVEVDDAELNQEDFKKSVRRKRQLSFAKRKIPVRNREYSEKDGWYTKEALEQIRFIMKKKIEMWLEKGEENDEDIIEEDEEMENAEDYRQQQQQQSQQQASRSAEEVDEVTTTEDIVVVNNE